MGRNAAHLPWHRRALYALFTWIAAIALVEFGLHLAGFAPSPTAMPERYSKYEPDPDLIWKLKPSWTGFEPNDAPVRTNALGLRGPEPGLREPGGLRILFVGDSVVFGHELRSSDTLTVRLEEVLRSSMRRPVEVINAGVPGYSTFQEVIVIRRLAAVLEPDLVLLGFCLNDVTERYQSLAGFGGQRLFMPGVDTTVGLSWPVRLWHRSAIRHQTLSLTRSAARQAETYRLAELWREPTSIEIDRAWELVLSELNAAMKEAKLADIPLAVVIFPIAEQISRETGFDAPQRRLVSHLTGEGVPYHDLLQAHRAIPAPRGWILQDQTHFSSRGAEEAARSIGEFIESSALLPEHP
jgi:lysophospholipase L1-like esterase